MLKTGLILILLLALVGCASTMPFAGPYNEAFTKSELSCGAPVITDTSGYALFPIEVIVRNVFGSRHKEINYETSQKVQEEISKELKSHIQRNYGLDIMDVPSDTIIPILYTNPHEWITRHGIPPCGEKLSDYFSTVTKVNARNLIFIVVHSDVTHVESKALLFLFPHYLIAAGGMKLIEANTDESVRRRTGMDNLINNFFTIGMADAATRKIVWLHAIPLGLDANLDNSATIKALISKVFLIAELKE